MKAHRAFIPLLLAAAVLAPRAAGAEVRVEAFYGITQPPDADFSTAVGAGDAEFDLFDSSLQLAGGSLIANMGAFELGVVADTSFSSDSARQLAIGALAGFGLELGTTRALLVEVLGELGAQRYGDFTDNPDLVTSSDSDQWFAYVGVRPGIAYRFNPAGAGLVIGLWGFARWDLDSTDVDVTVGSADDVSPGSVELGGTTIGLVGRLGFEF